MAKKETMQVVIDEGLKREFKSACVLDGTKMSEVVAALISTWLEQREEQKIQETTKPQKSTKP